MSDLTPEQLDEARAREAFRIHPYGVLDFHTLATSAARLARTGCDGGFCAS